MTESKDPNIILDFTGERFLPDNPEAKGEIELEHYHRYLLARSLARGKNVLDIASGEGYGSYLLSEVALSVTGVDLSEEAIQYARNHYQRAGLIYVQGSAADIPVEDSSIDLVVSFETIEHHDLHEEMMSEISRVLKKDGLLIISSPDKKEYADIPCYDNPYHVRELYLSEFKDLLTKYFSNISMLGQRIKYGSLIAPLQQCKASFESFKKMDGDYTANLGINEPLYFVAIASNKKLPQIPMGIYEDKIENANYVKEVVKIYEDNLIATYENNKRIMSEKDGQINGLYQTLAERDDQINELYQTLAERDDQINELYQTLAERDEQINSLYHTIAERDLQISRIYNSTSWRLTKPLRYFRRFLSLLTRSLSNISHQITDYTYTIWCNTPLNVQRNRKLKKSQYLPENVTYVPLLQAMPLKSKSAKLICFYLPQFHPIPENNAWWGEGFTEWTNVQPAQPQFVGHYQPHVPGELGYYNLLDRAVQQRQVELAKLYGIEGFCFYFYWFGGKRLLEAPIENYFNDSNLNLPFCLCWANENWSRRWDGRESEILIAQEHSLKDSLAFIQHVSHYMRDRRYIRIKGKPLLLVYRPNLIPSVKEMAKQWRNWCKNNSIGEIYLAYVQSFESVDPAIYGFDAAIEFPPNNCAPPNITEEFTPLEKEFACTIYDWRMFVEQSERYKEPNYRLFRGVCPCWDNTPRRKNHSIVLQNNSPILYQRWLENAINHTNKQFKNPDERLIFINAWNEWAEGAYLEPDTRYGYAFLQATRNSLEATTSNEVEWRHILLVGHDAHPHGAQTLVLYLAKLLKEQLNFHVELVLLGDGILLSEYEKYATVHRLFAEHDFDLESRRLAKTLFLGGVRNAIINTAVTGKIAAILKQEGFHVVSLIHELPGVIEQYQLHTHLEQIAEYADCVVFAAQQVHEGFEQFTNLAPDKAIILAQGLYKKNSICTAAQIQTARSELRKRFELPENAVIILSMAYADHRKGIDLYVEVAAEVCTRLDNAYFIWVGHFDENIRPQIEQILEENGIAEKVIFPGLDFKSDQYYAGSDIYALTSREDPFPTVVLEAMDAGLAIVAFDGAGGFCDVLRSIGNLLVPMYDTSAYAKAIVDLATNQKQINQLGQAGRELITEKYSFRQYVLDLLSISASLIRKVTVIVPNYNYAQYIRERINSIASQCYPIWELIILDDASTDNSVDVINSITSDLDIFYRVIINENNSGNVFSQWQKGLEIATGDFVWIAEADDLSEPNFLEKVIKPFEDAAVVISYSESMQIDSNGAILDQNYQSYVADISKNKWCNDYIADGNHEIHNCLAIKNTIPNVSGVIFRRDVLQDVLNYHFEEIRNYRVAGDWITYLLALTRGKIAFTAQPLNQHRRHDTSVTLSSFDLSQLKEILSVQKKVRGNYQLNDEVINQAAAYSQKLYEEFGLASNIYPYVKDHPELKCYT